MCAMTSRKSHDKTKLLNIFPNEVWIITVDNINESSDYQRVCNASSLFRTHLYPRAKEILFGGTIKNIIKGNFTPKFWKTLRQVCRLWRKGVDERLYCKKFYSHYKDIAESGDVIEILAPYRTTRNTFEKADDFTRFEDHFDASHLSDYGNPFLCRGIKLYITDYNFYETLEQYYAAAYQFLQSYGRCLWFCVIELFMLKSESRVEFYGQKLNKLLEKMPNLRVIQLNNSGGYYTFEPQALNELLQNEDSLTSFPLLSKLKYISPGLYGLPFIKKFLERNPHVQTVDARGTISDDALRLFMEQLPNLKTIACDIENDVKFYSFCDLQKVCKLEGLRLKANIKIVTCSQLFRELETRFSETLVELHLSVTALITDSLEPPKLSLQKLRALHLELNNVEWLDFLLPMKNTLEEISLVVTTNPENITLMLDLLDEQQKLIDLYMFWDKPECSNIWTLFPKLGELKTSTRDRDGNYSYKATRKDWKKRNVRLA